LTLAMKVEGKTSINNDSIIMTEDMADGQKIEGIKIE